MSPIQESNDHPVDTVDPVDIGSTVLQSSILLQHNRLLVILNL